MSGSVRIEVDSLGRIEVPQDKLWGAQTQRAMNHFHQGGERVPASVLRALAAIKIAAARINVRLEKLPANLGYLIEHAAGFVVRGELDEHFPLSIWQSGSGTQTNMNVNEVVANKAAELDGKAPGAKEPVHPNDHVNMSQSTNDAFPSAMHMAAVEGMEKELFPALEALAKTLRAKEEEFDGIIKMGRTHLQDAVPLTLGQEFSGYAAQVGDAIRRLHRHMDGLLRLPLGGTAVGTGLNAHPDFAELAVEELRNIAGFPFVPATNKFSLMAAHDDIVALSGSLRATAMAVYKIANDIRWLGSGPRCGIGELVLPANEPGSSIMPGKVNPSQCEAVTMACAQVFGLDAATGMAGSQGNFELNVYKPLMAYNILTSIRILCGAVASFNEHCLQGLQPECDRIEAYVNDSLMLVTALAPHIGYDKAARAAKHAHEHGMTLREACLKLALLSGEEYDRWVRPEIMANPGK